MDGYPNSLSSQCRESVNSSLNEKTCEKIRQSKEGLKVYLRQAHTHMCTHTSRHIYTYTYIPTTYIPMGTCTQNEKEIILSF